MKIENSNQYIKSDNLLSDVQQIIETAQNFAYRAVNIAMVQRNWLLGKRIAEEELQGKERAEYGAEIVKKLAFQLTQIYGNGFDSSNLYKFVDFYYAFPNIFHAVCGKSDAKNLDTVCLNSTVGILDTPSLKSFSLLTWSHYRTLLQVKDPDARNWYLREAAEQTWSVRTLQRNISSQYYFRLLQSHNKDLVKKEMQQNTCTFQQDKYEFIKNPVVAEFLGFAPNSDFTETELEKSITLQGNEQLFASKYKTYMPSEEELRAEIETQKRLFYLQRKSNENVCS